MLLDASMAAGAEMAAAARQLLDRAGVEASRVRLLSMQGPVVFYRPPSRPGLLWTDPSETGGPPGVVELGNAGFVAARTGIPVVNLLRDKDVAHGGLGAPLTGWFDWWYLRDPSCGRVVENIGGIANVTVLHAGAGPEAVTAFDVGPGNMVIDAVVTTLTNGARTFDRDGEMARRGSPHPALLDELLSHPYFARRPPKTTGREEFGTPFVEAVIDRAMKLGVTPEDMVATVTELTAAATERALRDLVLPGGQVDEIVLTGGGAYNPALVRAIERRLRPMRVRRYDEFGIPAEAREAVAWAAMGAMSVLERQPVTLPSVTGVVRSLTLGSLTRPA